MIRILIADDHSLIREGLKKTLREESDMKIVGEAVSAEEVISRIHNVDLLLLDVSLPGKSGLELLRDLKPHLKKLRVLILSMYPERLFATRALKAGASGYITKGAEPEELLKAIRLVACGRLYVSPAVASQLADAVATGGDPGTGHELLSGREFEILRLIGSGEKISAIAKRLSISIQTVHTYRSRILTKLNLSTTSELVRYVVEKGLLP